MTDSVVVAGEALVDVVAAPDGTLAGHPGGGPYNVARTIGRLEQPVLYLGRVSTDGLGAGDAFMGAFLAHWRSCGLGRAELGQGEPLIEATPFACRVAAQRVPGPAPNRRGAPSSTAKAPPPARLTPCPTAASGDAGPGSSRAPGARAGRSRSADS